MNYVKIFNTEKIYTIFQFVNMIESDRIQLKNDIRCPICGNTAYYVKTSKNGKCAYFAAKHKPNCSHSIQKSNKYRITWNNLIKTFAEYKYKNIKTEITKITEKNNSLTLKQILELIETNHICEENYIIIENEEFLMKDCIKKFENINNKDIGKKIFYWGKILNVKDSWINIKCKNNISILLNNSIKEKFYEIWKIETFRAFENIRIIIYGEVKQSKRTKLYIELTNIKFCYIEDSV